MTTTTTIHIADISQLSQAAARLAEVIKASGRRLVAFDGPMGAGKTTLISALVKHLGADEDEANSPSFSIVNVYDTPQGPIYHFDLYRLDSPEEALDLGIYDYLDSGNYCFLEWPERAGSLLEQEDILMVTIDVADDDDDTHSRILTVS